ncbi:MAG: hypothetical protein IJC97_02220 [Oscillospiraceae bacterium]|nr:hypothetical protein [Oscillospiraceae bacterium]
MKELKMEIAKIKYNLRWLDLVLLDFPLDYITQKLNYFDSNLTTFLCWQIVTFWLILYIIPKQISKLIIKLSPESKVRKFLSSCHVLNGILISCLLMLKPFVKMQFGYLQLISFVIVWLMVFGLYMLLCPQEKDQD